MTALGLGLVLVALGATVNAPPSSASSAGASQVRIMIAGDSITQGFDGDFTWRYRLATEFGRQRVPVDFVGPRPYTYGGDNVYLVTGWDSDHDATGGTRLAWQLDHITADMTAYRPDVLVALYGTTDLLHGATPDDLVALWREYIAKVREVRPDTMLVIGEVFTRRIERRVEANEKVRALADELTTPESPVVVVDLDFPQWVPERHTYDTTHPTPTGETWIAQKVGEVLHDRAVLPAQPRIGVAYAPWTPPVRPVVQTKKRRLSVDWAVAKRRYKANQMRVRWTNLRTGRVRTSAWQTSSTHLVTRRMGHGRYRVVLGAMRGTMASRWGPPVHVRLPRHARR